MSGYRLGQGGLVDRDAPIGFSFDGRAMHGLAGDTLASALIASGVRLVGRSFKYHRPRGIMAAGCEEPNALVTLGAGARAAPNTQATMAPLSEGLTATSQNRWPALRLDLRALAGLAGPALSAGFYYKTFMGPTARAWMWFEPLIRRAAGLGLAPDGPDPDVYDHRNHFTDVLVVGAGISGLAAAMRAAEAGLRVTIADQAIGPGGVMRGAAAGLGGQACGAWAESVWADLGARGVTRLPRTTVFGLYDGTTLGAVEETGLDVPRQRVWTIRAGQVVLATGAFERPLVFPGNDRPGVMLCDAIRRYAEEYGVAAGRRIVLFTNNDSAYGAADALQRAGVGITALADLRPDPPEACRSLADRAGIELLAGHAVTATHGAQGLRAVTLRPVDGGAERRIAADCLGTSGGWAPVIHLPSQMDRAPAFDERLQAFVPGAPTGPWRAAGAAAGIYAADACRASGAGAGAAAAAAITGDEMVRTAPAAADHDAGDSADATFLARDPAPVGALPGRGKALVDFQNDVTAGDVALAHREGYRAVEHLKRYTTLGMATDQGKTSGVNAIALLADAAGQGPAETGTTRFRPPYTPVTLGALAGRRRGRAFEPDRRTPMHDWHVDRDAVMSPVGAWWRPRAYPAPGESLRDAAIREARAVRDAVGLCDVSTLGKIEVQGPDAAEFLDRVYANAMRKLPVGRARYGLMLRVDGMLLDDGTLWRLGEDRFLMTTTTGGAGAVMAHLEELLALAWPDLRVAVASVTAQWAGMSLAGPRAREVLAQIIDGADVGAGALPFMGLCEVEAGDIPVTVARLSFSGELAFELFCPADRGRDLWERVIAAGAPMGLVPYGTEALGTLRIEKGHVAGGELDGRVSAHDLGLAGLLSSRKPFIGKALADRPGLLSEERPALVGLVSMTGVPLRAGAHLVNGPADAPGPSEGHVTSTTYSPALDREIALALVSGGGRRIGERLYAADPVHDSHVEVECVSPHFLDPEGRRMRDAEAVR